MAPLPPPPPSSSSSSSSSVVPPMTTTTTMMMMMSPSQGSSTTGNFHPEFMFCGVCTTCQTPDGDGTMEETQQPFESDFQDKRNHDDALHGSHREEDDRDDSNNSNDGSFPVLRSTLDFVEPLAHRRFVVIRSALQGQPGVYNVYNVSVDETAPSVHSIQIDHDTQISKERILHVLQTLGHATTVREQESLVVSTTSSLLHSQQQQQVQETTSSNTTSTLTTTNITSPSWVRSEFHVQGMCCTSEVPIVRRILRPIPGISKVQINITTKIVYVQHDVHVVLASYIATRLTMEGFPTKIKKDGARSIIATNPHENDNNNNKKHQGTTKLYLLPHNNLTKEQGCKLEQVFQTIPGVYRITVSINDGIINISHNVQQLSSLQCVEQFQKLQEEWNGQLSVLDSSVSSLQMQLQEQTSMQTPFLLSSSSSIPAGFVQSELELDGIYGSADIPHIKESIQPLHHGISELVIDTTHNRISIAYNPSIVSAMDIASKLTKDGFFVKKTKKKRRSGKNRNSGEIQSTLKELKHIGQVRTTLRIQGNRIDTKELSDTIKKDLTINDICCHCIKEDVHLLSIDHDISQCSPLQCVEQIQAILKRNKHDATVASSKHTLYQCEIPLSGHPDDSRFQSVQELQLLLLQDDSDDSDDKRKKKETDVIASILDSIGRSTFVESTLSLPNVESPLELKALQQSISKQYDPTVLRAIYPNFGSRTLKVEHDPSLVSIQDVCQVAQLHYELEHCKRQEYNNNTSIVAGGDDDDDTEGTVGTVNVAVNGADLKLYLPKEHGTNDVSEDETYNKAFGDDDYDGFFNMWKIHFNVALSGVFWVVSMLGLRGGSWKNMKFCGLLSVLFGMPPILIKALRTIRRRQFDSNCMMVTAAIGAVALGEFDEAASVSFLFSISELLEARATRKARKALSAIVSLRPDHANVIHPYTKEITVVPADKVPLGSHVSVKTGDKIVADGIVIEGSSAVDESSLTGESKPSHKTVHDTVSGGTINIGSSQLVVKTTTTVEDSAVARLIRLVEEAQSCRSPTEKMVDTFARSYTPSVVCMAAVMCTLPWLWGPEVGRYWTLKGLILIVIACPCALTISTPVTYAAGLAATAQRGIIIKGGSKLEAMGSVDRIVFDKTGTLTQGKFSVINLELIGHSKTRQEMLELLSLLQGRSSHPLSMTLVDVAKKEGIAVPTDLTISEHNILKGEGVTAKVDGTSVYAGNQRLFERLGMFQKLTSNYKDLVQSWATTGGTIGFLGTEQDGIIGAFCVKDAVRPEAHDVIQELNNDLNIETSLCTGDSSSAADAVAKELGMPLSCVYSQLLPEDKLHYVGSLKRPQPAKFALCRTKRYTLFCGDGVNDAPALAVADIGVSMGEGAAMAMEMSDVTLMDSNLAKLPYSIHMGRRVLSTVKENIFISLSSKLLVIVLALAGKMSLLGAIAADVGIMLTVTLNGMKLLPNPTGASALTDVAALVRPKRRNKYTAVTNKDVDTIDLCSAPLDVEEGILGNDAMIV